MAGSYSQVSVRNSTGLAGESGSALEGPATCLNLGLTKLLQLAEDASITRTSEAPDQLSEVCRTLRWIRAQAINDKGRRGRLHYKNEDQTEIQNPEFFHQRTHGLDTVDKAERPMPDKAVTMQRAPTRVPVFEATQEQAGRPPRLGQVPRSSKEEQSSRLESPAKEDYYLGPWSRSSLRLSGCWGQCVPLALVDHLLGPGLTPRAVRTEV